MPETTATTRPDVIVIMTDEERAIPPYESDELLTWRRDTLSGRRWFDDNAVTFARHYTGSLACVPSRPTLFTGQYPDVHGVTPVSYTHLDVYKRQQSTRPRVLDTTYFFAPSIVRANGIISSGIESGHSPVAGSRHASSIIW